MYNTEHYFPLKVVLLKFIYFIINIIDLLNTKFSEHKS